MMVSMRMRQWMGTLSVVVLAGILAACGSGPTKVEREPGHVVIEMRDMRFVPEEIVVEPGTQIVFVNMDRMSHNVVAGKPGDRTNDAGFRSPILGALSEWAITFEEEGVYDYMCTVNSHHLSGMVGRIIVRSEDNTFQANDIKGGRADDGELVG